MYSDEETRSKVYEFLEKYGDKGYLVLRVAIDIAYDPEIDHRLGDFSYKHLVFRLQRMGVNYSPHNLLRILEREYGLIEKTYISTTQKWWRFVDPEGVRRALLEYNGVAEVDDPRIRLLMIKYRSMEPQNILNTLRRLAVKSRLSNVDKELFRRIVFNELDILANLLNDMMAYEDVFEEEIRVLNEILALADRIASRISGLERSRKKELRLGYVVREKYDEKDSVEPW